MAHKKVKRQSMPIKKWLAIVFKQIEEYIIKDRTKIKGWKVRNAEYSPDNYIWKEKEFSPIKEGEIWGGPDTTSVFKSQFKVPKSYEKETVYFYMYTSGEVIVSENGKFLNGIDPNRKYFKYLENANTNITHNIKLEAYTRSRPDDTRNMDTEQKMGCVQYFNPPELVLIDEKMLDLYYDLKTIYDVAYSESIDENSKEFLKYHLKKLLKLFPEYDCSRKEMSSNLSKIKDYINKNIYKGNSYFGKQGKVALVGHSHLDIAYHWTAKQTIQKNARTTLIQLKLMEDNPEFKYSHSQAWTYETLEKYYPELFLEMKEKIKKGQWEIVGGMYVEPDCNLINSESFVRQLLYGKNYFKNKFGVDVDNVWLPDVFGNSPIMPQIMKSGGIDYFVTHKLSVWNDTNKFPHNMFLWKGLDGTQINASIPPIHFVTWMDPDETKENWEKFQNKNICDETLQLYGYGDGGSGVTEEMLEVYKRQEKLPGIPKQRLTTGKDYLHKAFQNSNNLEVWEGDLYLETHRGTYTSQGKLKKYNRRGEFIAQETETLSTFSDLFVDNFNQQKTIKEAWKKLLLNQFHDILPGTHTNAVYVEALETYKEMFDEFKELKQKALNNLTISSKENDYFAFNSLSDFRDDLAYIEKEEWDNDYNGIKDLQGNIYPVQKSIKSDGKIQYINECPQIKGLSLMQLKAVKRANFSSDMKVSTNKMENKYFILKLSSNGEIISLYDKSKNKYVNAEDEKINKWQMFEDKPGKLNAWDIVETYENQKRELTNWSNIEVIEDGPVSIAIRMEMEFNNSNAVQIIRMFNNKKRIDFDTWVDWHEEEKLLKVSFPVNVKSQTYTVDTSAGGYERLNNKNTSWQKAKFEVPCHKWIDMSDGLFGVSIMNNCKYGCDIKDNVMRLSLLRSPIAPNRESDQGEHKFTYSVFTHEGNWQTGGLSEAAYDLNHPLKIHRGKLAFDEWNPVEIKPLNLKCQSFKLAEDGSSDIIIRLSEVYGTSGKAKLSFNINIDSVFICNIMEENKKELKVKNNVLNFDFKPNEIISLRIKRK